jgi:tRNA (guanine37-N1)-methyltransferase
MKIFKQLFSIFNPQIKKMKFHIENVKGLKKLDRSLFICKTQIPMIKIEKSKYNDAKNLLKKFCIDMPKVNKKFSDLNEENAQSKTHKGLLLDPEKFKSIDESFNENIKEILQKKYNFNPDDHFDHLNVELNYEYFQYDDIVRFILPDEILNENMGAKSFSTIGHVAHFNLRSELADYRYIIGKLNQLNFVLNYIFSDFRSSFNR